MAYAGEVVRVISRIKDFHGDAVTSEQGVTVSLDVFDHLHARVLTSAEMTWDDVGNADGPYWFYDWATPATSGSYRMKVTVVGGSFDTFDAWQYQRVRLAKNPEGSLFALSVGGSVGPEGGMA